jgi:signal peptidase I
MSVADVAEDISPVTQPSPSATSQYASADQTARESIESVVVAVILAFLFRAFVAEAFVIPTGSMAPTLQGRHMDLVCSQCGHQYRTGASVENRDLNWFNREVTRTRCPICSFTTKLDKESNPNHKSFNGDRILVSKFAYQIAEPERWDVIVFKFPGEAKINYIKRLIGLPGETIQIRHGDIYTLDRAESAAAGGKETFRIARKPPDKVLAMLQVVDDTFHVSQQLRDGLWPPRWTATQAKDADADAWHRRDDHRGFAITAGATWTWLRYRHLVPSPDDWKRIEQRLPYQLAGYRGQLISDYYAYNDAYPPTPSMDPRRDCWVGDLALEAQVDIQSDRGEITLDLVEGGSQFQCLLDVATGIAKLSMNGGSREFRSGSNVARQPSATTKVRGPGSYRLRLANVDDQLILWVDDRVTVFDGPTTYDPRSDVVPHWSPTDAGDLSPVGIGARNVELQLNRMRVLRDVYYRALEPVEEYSKTEYDASLVNYEFDVLRLFAEPQEWATTPLFKARRSVTFHLGADQFLPLGDNSPESSDARLWFQRHYMTNVVWPPPYVKRELLIGKALFVYWPHSWRLLSDKLPIIPNFQRIGAIR